MKLGFKELRKRADNAQTQSEKVDILMEGFMVLGDIFMDEFDMDKDYKPKHKRTTI